LRKTGFFFDEECFWHSGGNYAFLMEVGGNVQPQASGGLPENPETKRRLKNLVEKTGLINDLHCASAPPATQKEILSVHDDKYIRKFQKLSRGKGGDFGERAPFGPGGYEIAARSAGLAKKALFDVLTGKLDNSYALSRPPGHHCLPGKPMGYCLLANIAIAVESAIRGDLAQRVAVIDWDVHHGNGTEDIFYERDDVLTISLHQENNYPLDSGGVNDRGKGKGKEFNINIPLLPGSGHDAYLYAFDQIVLPALEAYRPDVIVVACGFDASGVDPLSRMLAGAYTFAEMTKITMQAANRLCAGKLVMAHEGGYSETYVPFCGHAVLQTLSGSSIEAADPLHNRISKQQPNKKFQKFQRDIIDEMAGAFGNS